MAALASDRAQTTSVEHRPRRHRIMLVDDNVDFATSMAMLLQGLGHEVLMAHDALEALSIAREHTPEFAFLDLGMPRVSGYELARRLRSEPETAGIVLIALSGWGQARDRERSREAGFALHLVKPVEVQNIEAVLKTLVDGK
jgi:CheY-like chemotaxis protein